MKKVLSVLTLGMILCLMLGTGPALADFRVTEAREAVLPDGVHRLTLPAGMIVSSPKPEETDLKGVFRREPDLEMLVFAWDAQGSTVEGLAEALTENGREAQVREIAGERFLVYQDADPADGAPCVGYSYLFDGWLIEIDFFYGSQDAANLTRDIMETFH